MNTKALLAAMSILLICSCSAKKSGQETTAPSDLYAKTITLIEAYTDTLAKSSDTLSVNLTVKALDEALAQLSLEYPSGTDFLLDELQNDSICAKMDFFLTLKSLKINKLSQQYNDTALIGTKEIANNVAQ